MDKISKNDDDKDDDVSSPKSVLSMNPSTPVRKSKSQVPADAEGTVFTPAGRRSARIAHRRKDD
jgi:hypothetical protein